MKRKQFRRVALATVTAGLVAAPLLVSPGSAQAESKGFNGSSIRAKFNRAKSLRTPRTPPPGKQGFADWGPEAAQGRQITFGLWRKKESPKEYYFAARNKDGSTRLDSWDGREQLDLNQGGLEFTTNKAEIQRYFATEYQLKPGRFRSIRPGSLKDIAKLDPVVANEKALQGLMGGLQPGGKDRVIVALTPEVGEGQKPNPTDPGHYFSLSRRENGTVEVRQLGDLENKKTPGELANPTEEAGNWANAGDVFRTVEGSTAKLNTSKLTIVTGRRAFKRYLGNGKPLTSDHLLHADQLGFVKTLDRFKLGYGGGGYAWTMRKYGHTWHYKEANRNTNPWVEAGKWVVDKVWGTKYHETTRFKLRTDRGYEGLAEFRQRINDKRPEFASPDTPIVGKSKTRWRTSSNMQWRMFWLGLPTNFAPFFL